LELARRFLLLWEALMPIEVHGVLGTEQTWTKRQDHTSHGAGLAVHGWFHYLNQTHGDQTGPSCWGGPNSWVWHTFGTPPIGSQCSVLFWNAVSAPFAACFRLWGHFILMDGSRLAGIDLSDAIVEASIWEIMRMF
jgi:hypothetical protein